VGRPQHDFRLLLLDYPLRPLEWGGYETDSIHTSLNGSESMEELYEKHAAYQRIMRAVAKREQIPFLDTRAQFQDRALRPFTLADPIHPNQVGMQLLGDLVYQELDALGWLTIPSEAR
jgi:hypothetical protein